MVYLRYLLWVLFFLIYIINSVGDIKYKVKFLPVVVALFSIVVNIKLTASERTHDVRLNYGLPIILGHTMEIIYYFPNISKKKSKPHKSIGIIRYLSSNVPLNT